eukprot:236538-Pyramimonas_sp.AAC.1
MARTLAWLWPAAAARATRPSARSVRPWLPPAAARTRCATPPRSPSAACAPRGASPAPPPPPLAR